MKHWLFHSILLLHPREETHHDVARVDLLDRLIKEDHDTANIPSPDNHGITDDALISSSTQLQPVISDDQLSKKFATTSAALDENHKTEQWILNRC